MIQIFYNAEGNYTVSMDVNLNVHHYVDLGLPSGTLWATCNVGADKPSDAGLYFQWGDVQGHTESQVGKNKQFDWDYYKFSINGSHSNFSKYTTTGAKLDLVDDAANANMGGDWHMPTPEQINELINNTTNTWTTQDGVNGRLFTSKKDASKSIFIPAAGYAWDDLIDLSGSYGGIWSSMSGTHYVDGGQYLRFNSSGVSLGSYGYRYGGLSVRGVIG